MATYKIVSHGGSGLPLNVYGTGTITSRRNVCIWTDTGSADQQWAIDSLGSNQTVRSMNNQSYMLNANRSGSTWNCDVYTLNADCYVNFISLGNNVYRIQLKSDTTKYLKALGTSSNSDVRWAVLDTTSNAQSWKIVMLSGGTSGSGSKELVMPVNHNQKISNDTSNWIFKNGCAVCCGADVASYYAGRRVEVSEMAYNTSDGFSWAGPAVSIATKITKSNEADILPLIKAQIDANRPPIVGLYNAGTNRHHYIVPFKYKNGAASKSDITCLDPAGTNGAATGAIRTITESLSYNNKKTIVDIRYTSPA